MFRQIVSSRPLISANRALIANRTFSIAVPRMGAGDTGAPRAGGVASSDSFSRKEAAEENIYIREKEMEKLRALKRKLAEQRKHLDELDKHIDDLTREQGGEKN